MSSANLLERPGAGRRWSPQLFCGLTLTLVFMCGAAIGALAMDFGIHNRVRTPAFETTQGKAAYFARMQKELDLTPAQAEQMQSILNDFWQYYRTVLSESKMRIEQLLNDQQRRKFEKLLQQQAPGK
jgi:hypothetical protein